MSSPHHVFVCYSALSLDAARRISAQFEPRERQRTHVLAMFEIGQATFAEGVRVSMMAPPPQSHSEWTRPFATARWFRGCLDSHELKDSDVIAYIPHPFELPGNHFLFSGKTRRVELLPDGLINYYRHTLEPRSLNKALRLKVRQALRVLAARRFGLRYHAYTRGHITQYERGLYDRTWAENPNGLLTVSGELRTLPPRSTRRAEQEVHSRALSGPLFLDQELGGVLDRPLEERLREGVMTMLKSLSPDGVSYKAHPRGANRADELRHAGIPVEDLTGPELAEELIAQRTFSSLVGFFSTPLVLSAGEVERRISLLPPENTPGVIRPHRVQALREAMQNSKVELVGVELTLK